MTQLSSGEGWRVVVVGKHDQELPFDDGNQDLGASEITHEGPVVAGAKPARYQYEIRAGWMLQPNFQHIVHPDRGATNPLGNSPGRALKNADVFGFRTVVRF
jgi:Carbohydrate-selective porin, OprB family